MEKSFFAKNLISIRKTKGISQRDLAKKTGISTRMIAYYEGKSSIPSIEILKKLANALNVTVAELVDPEHKIQEIQNLNTRTIKKIQLLEQLPPEDQRKVLDYIKDLLDKNKLQKQLVSSNK